MIYFSFYFKNFFCVFLRSLGQLIENCVSKSQRSPIDLVKFSDQVHFLLAKILIVLVFPSRNSAINTQHTDCQQLNLYLVDENLDFRAFNSSKFHKYKTVFAATKHTAGPAGTHSRVKSMPHKIRTRHTLPRASSSKKGVSELIFLTMDLAHPWPSGGYKANFFSTIFGGIHKQCDVLN